LVPFGQGFQAEWRMAHFRANTKAKRAVRNFVLDIIPLIDRKFRTTTGDGWRNGRRRRFNPLFIIATFLRDKFIS